MHAITNTAPPPKPRRPHKPQTTPPQVDPAHCTFQAGQWVDLWAPGIKEAGGFSIVTSPAELAAGGTFDLGVKATAHPVAQWLCGPKAEEGAKVRRACGVVLRCVCIALFQNWLDMWTTPAAEDTRHQPPTNRKTKRRPPPK
jgi:hypothetical protein